MTALLFSAGLTLVSCNKFESFDSRCEREAKEFTEKNCPKKQDEYTWITGMEYNAPQKEFIYTYTVEGEYDKAELYTQQVKDAYKEQTLESTINSISLKKYKEEGITFTHRILSAKDKSLRMQVSITPQDYQP